MFVASAVDKCLACLMCLANSVRGGGEPQLQGGWTRALDGGWARAPANQPSPTSPFPTTCLDPAVSIHNPVVLDPLLNHQRIPYLTTLFKTACMPSRSIEVPDDQNL